ncbi:MAG: hypothetical protein AB8G77_11975 [Rhodothermales bacterium]
MTVQECCAELFKEPTRRRLVHVRIGMPDAWHDASAVLVPRKVSACQLSALMGFSASTGALLELNMLTTESAPLSGELLRWGNLAIYMLLAPMAWFVCQFFQTGRRWLAVTSEAMSQTDEA